MSSDVELLDLLGTAEVFETYCCKLRIAHEHLSSEYEHCKQKVSSLSEKLKRVENENRDSTRLKNETIEALEGKVSELQEELRSANRKIGLLDPQRTIDQAFSKKKHYGIDLQQQKRKSDHELLAIRKEHEERMRLANAANETKLNVLLSRIETLDSVNDDSMKLRELNFQLTRTVSELNTNLKEQSKHITKLKTEYDSTMSSMNLKLAEVNEMLNVSQRSNAIHESSSNGYRIQLKVLEEKLRNSNSVISELNERMNHIDKNNKSELPRSPPRLNENDDLLTMYKTELSDAKTENDVLRMQLKNLQYKINRMKNREQQLWKKLKERLHAPLLGRLTGGGNESHSIRELKSY